MNAEDLLHEARKAWRERNAASLELSRLRKYARETPGMKHDRAKWERQQHEADATLRRILGGEHEYPEP